MIGMTNASLNLNSDSIISNITDTDQVEINPTLFPQQQAPYSQTILLQDYPQARYITGSSTPIISMYVPDSITQANIKAYEKAYGSITKIETGYDDTYHCGKITVYCYYRKPSMSVWINIKGRY